MPDLLTEVERRSLAGEILRHIQEESIDPPIGAEAEGVLSQLKSDPLQLEKNLSKIRA